MPPMTASGSMAQKESTSPKPITAPDSTATPMMSGTRPPMRSTTNPMPVWHTAAPTEKAPARMPISR